MTASETSHSVVRPGTTFEAPAGTRRRFGPMRGQPGGEGSIYAVDEEPGLVAKLYHDSMRPDKVAKITALIEFRRAHPELAWCGLPTDLIRINGVPRGFLMPYFADCSEIHLLSSPTSRKQAFPQVRFDFLLHVAGNLVSEIAKLHAAGIVIGDVNCRGFMVDRAGLVHVIDCDSFQFTAQGTTYRCDVGMPEYLPPELQLGPSLAGFDRVVNHDAFAIGVLLFQLLFQDRHPYFGVPLNPREPALELPAIIKRHRFAYGARAFQLGVRRPPHALALEHLPDSLRSCFERTFSAFSTEVGRPLMPEWRQGLAEGLASLVECPDDRSHLYFRQSGTCPWCAIEDAGGPRYFPGFVRTSGQIVPIPTSYFRKILLLHRPVGALAPTTNVSPSAFTEHLAASQGTHRYLIRLAELSVQRAAAALALVTVLASASQLIGWWTTGALLICAGLTAVLAPPFLERWREQRKSRSKRHLAALEFQYETIQLVLGQIAAMPDFAVMARYDQALRDLEALIPASEQRWQVWQTETTRLSTENEQLQLQDYLARFPVRNLRHPGIDEAMRTALIAHGIATAAEVNQRLHRGIPQIPDTVVGHLDAWCDVLRSGFRFNPKISAGSERIDDMNQRFLRQKTDDERHLNALVQRLTNDQDAALAAAARMPDHLRSRQRLLAQATPDSGELPGLHCLLAQVTADIAVMRTIG